MRIRLAPHARADLDEIWLHVAHTSGSLPTATRVIEVLSDKFRLLSQYPYLGRSLASEGQPEIWMFVAEDYLIFYRPKSNELRILRIIHASRDAFAVFAGE